MHKHTKIVATIGPASDSPEMLGKLIDAGVNVFRFNLKHSELDWHRERVLRVREAAKQKGVIIGMLADLQGPEIRLETKNKEVVPLLKDQEVIFSVDTTDEGASVYIPVPQVVEAISVGDKLLIDDGKHELIVISADKRRIVARSIKDGVIEHRKSLNLPGIPLNLSPLHERDYAAIKMAAELEIPYLALSFVRSAEDINLLRTECQKESYTPNIIAKIENQQALLNFQEILDATDAVMIARGDLGIENPIEEIAFWQKHIIRESRKAGKPVITATQMLESMMGSPIPTRAEATDISNAVFDGTDAVMLSGETAMGEYPLEVVQTMAKIVIFTEHKGFVQDVEWDHSQDQTSVMTHAMIDILNQPRDFAIDAIVLFTETGRTAYNVARFRAHKPIIAMTRSQMVCDQMALAYGIDPMIASIKDSPDQSISMIEPTINQLKEQKMIQAGHRVLFIHGDVWSIPGKTNTVTLKEIV